jgi:predicted dehydrogenase
VRLTTNFYVGHHSKQRGIEFHGDRGSLHIESWQEFDARVEIAEFGGAYEPIPTLAPAFRGTDWGRALAELGDAVAAGRPHRPAAEHAAHVVEILDAITTSLAEGRPVSVTSTFVPPPPPQPGVRVGAAS